MKKELEKIRAVKKKYESDWLQLDDVVAVGIGQIGSHGTGIIISVKKKPINISQIPKEIEGIPIRLQQTGPIRTH